jgi:hypothetical protein
MKPSEYGPFKGGRMGDFVGTGDSQELDDVGIIFGRVSTQNDLDNRSTWWDLTEMKSYFLLEAPL